MQDEEWFDITIVGGGPAGLFAAFYPKTKPSLEEPYE